MARFFPIVAFIICLNIFMSYENTLGVFQYQTPTNPQLNGQFIAGLAGCNVYKTGNSTCAASPGPSSSGTILGGIASTVLVFGNFLAAAQFIAQVAFGAALPYTFLTGWGMDPGLALAISAMVWLAYATTLFYIISGRPLDW